MAVATATQRDSPCTQAAPYLQSDEAPIAFAASCYKAFAVSAEQKVFAILRSPIESSRKVTAAASHTSASHL